MPPVGLPAAAAAVAAAALPPVAASSGKPNIVWFLTDDVDQLLGGSFPATAGATPMPRTKALMQEQGMMADNFYIHTPICSPSRSELVSGRYFHNIKKTGHIPGYANGMHVDYDLVNANTFFVQLKAAGYATAMFGKYLNNVPAQTPPGIDAWLANGGGNYIAPAFNTAGIAEFGFPDGKWQGTVNDYTTSVVGNLTVAWIKKVAPLGEPWFAYAAPKAAHEPFVPAPWHLNSWGEGWPETEPRTPNWNVSADVLKGHHGNVGREPLITEKAAAVITGIFKDRWRTLMSVDDLIADVIAVVDTLGQSDKTYFFYSSDHGFQLGQFNIPMDKRHVYEWNIKIHLLARGPGIAPGSTFAAPATQVDMAPTFLGLAGVAAPAEMDGKSLVPFLVAPFVGPKGGGALLDSTRQHLASLPGLAAYTAAWREEVFVEYYYCLGNTKCVANCTDTGTYPKADCNCADLQHGGGGAACWDNCFNGPLRGGVPGGAPQACNMTGQSWEPNKGNPTKCNQECYITEDTTNNFIAIRTLGKGDNALYAEFQTGDLTFADVDFATADFVEYYNVSADPWQMRNAVNDTPPERIAALHARVQQWYACKGAACP